MTSNEYMKASKGVKSIPGIKSAKRRVLITKTKNGRREVITPRKRIANVFGEFYKKLYDDNEQEETEQEIDENEQQHQCDDETEEWQNAFSRLKKTILQTATESEQKTSKQAMMGREKWWDKSSTKS